MRHLGMIAIKYRMKLSIYSAAGTLVFIFLLGGCAGPPALQRSVIGYDETTARLEQQLLLLNIARVNSGLPIHFTTTSSIAATFDWTSTLGLGGQIQETKGTNFLDLRLGASASENPTFSIVPVTGEQFTKRVLTPFREGAFNLGVFQGERIDRLMRLMSKGIEVQGPNGSFVRQINNDPSKPGEFEEFRRLATHLQWLNSNQQLFVRKLVFIDRLVEDFKGQPRSKDITEGLGKGVTWRQKQDGNWELTRLLSGRVLVANYDPIALSDKQRFQLNGKLRKSPESFVHLDIRPGDPGGNFPVRGAIKLRSLSEIIAFIADGIYEAPEFDVKKDPRTGEIDPTPPLTLKINVTDSEPQTNVPSIRYAGKYYSVADNKWDRRSFTLLSSLFQTAVGEIRDVGLPITIAK
jgi:hypothetical protein